MDEGGCLYEDLRHRGACHHDTQSDNTGALFPAQIGWKHKKARLLATNFGRACNNSSRRLVALFANVPDFVYITREDSLRQLKTSSNLRLTRAK